MPKLKYDLSWLSPETLKGWPFKDVDLINTSYLENTLNKEFSFYKEANTNNNSNIKTPVLKVGDYSEVKLDGFKIEEKETTVNIYANEPEGLLYGFFHIVRLFQQSKKPELSIISNPKNKIRMINHWDNFDGSVERGYAGKSLFFIDNKFRNNDHRIQQYAKMLASVGINSLTINNVNVHELESYFITDKYIEEIKHLAKILKSYGLTLFLSVNYAAPIDVGGLDTADPLEEDVKTFWKDIASFIYKNIPDFGGFVIKADSENRPGPFTYRRTHAEGANMIGAALEPYGGIVFWRCFVYDNHQDWRDRTTDRARAAYDHFAPIDGEFSDNVILQIKNGPMDFQV